MSRWSDEFKSHAFQSTWTNLKIELDKVTIDDETIFTSVNELARLKKVIVYLDGMIDGIDPEIVPMTTWDNFNAQATPCLQQLQEYHNSRNIVYIQNANSNADNLLTYIRPYMVTTEKIGTVLQNAINSYAQTIDEHGESFRKKSIALVAEINGYNEQSQNLFQKIQAKDALIEQFNTDLFGGDEADNGIKNKVNDWVGEFENKYEAINKYYDETLVGNDNDLSTKKEIAQAKETILAEQQSIQNLLANVSTNVEELDKFHGKIFGKLNDSGNLEGGLSGELDKRTQVLSDFEVKQQTKYKALNEQIESLMPGATSTGLASAYYDMKMSFNDPIKDASKLFFWSVGIIVLIATFSTIDSFGMKDIESIKDGVIIHSAGMPYMNFVKLTDWDTVLKGLVSRIPFYAPVLWLAFYASKRRSECQRLQQEYAHKEALSKSYDKYKKQIEDLDNEDPELQKLLITKAIDAIAYNASNTLDRKHGDKMPVQDLIEKVVGVALKKSKDS
jgi:hypothetical protein